MTLTVLGAVLEFLGIFLVARAARQARREASDFLRKDIVIPVGQVIDRGKPPPITRGGGAPPTVEQRLDQLERRIGELPDEIDGRIARLDDTLREDFRATLLQAREHAEKRDTEVRRFIADHLGAVGSALFAFGLAMQT